MNINTTTLMYVDLDEGMAINVEGESWNITKLNHDDHRIYVKRDGTVTVRSGYGHFETLKKVNPKKVSFWIVGSKNKTKKRLSDVLDGKVYL